METSDISCVEKYETFIKESLKTLHTNHWILTQVRVNILEIFDSFGKIDLDNLRIVAEQGKELVKLFKILRLGSISLRGFILYYWRLIFQNLNISNTNSMILVFIDQMS